MNKSKQQGFTLIEILVAGTILFIVLVAVSQSYKTSVNNSDRAATVLENYATVPYLTETIAHYLHQSNPNEVIEQEGVLDERRFSWRAEVAERGRAPERMSADSGDFETQPERFYLWNVELTLYVSNERAETFSYQELTWQN
jgi:type II secretory pathway pseudopilin PulG